MKISELLDGIQTRSIVMPEFQREYVWNREQAKQLLSSLMKEFPVGGLLFWKTDKPPELKNVDVLPEKLGTVTVILDGQQRLTTLYLLMRGGIPPFYRESDITHDPRDLYFNIDSGDLQYYTQMRMKDNPLWHSVVGAFTGAAINVFEIAQRSASSPEHAFELAQRYSDNLTRLRGIQNIQIPEQLVPLHANLEQAITIFDLVNSQGTKLTEAELALTHVTGKWSQARRVIKQKAELLGSAHYYFDLTFMTRALTAVVTQRALYETIHSRQRPELEDGWTRLSGILDYLATTLPKRAHIDSTRDLSTNNVLVPLVRYLSQNNGKFPDDRSMKQAIHWLYAAQIWARYTAQTDQRLEQDLSIIVREDNPWIALCNQIIDQRGRLEVKAADLEGRGIQHPVHNMGFILSKAVGAIDWLTGEPLTVLSGKPYSLQSVWIFPANLLYKSGYDSDNHIHRTMVNEIANRVVLKNGHPFEGKSPEEYLPLIEEKNPGALSRQFIPLDTEFWRPSKFADFLAARRETMAMKINEHMRALISEPTIVHQRPIAELIALGESATLEFKSTLQWDVVHGMPNAKLRKQVLKSIAAFLNSGGGTLIIGVEDNGNAIGLEYDMRQVPKKDKDGFQNLVASLVSEYIGPEFSPYWKLRFETISECEVCVIDVERASEPAFLKGDGGQKEFYVRAATTSQCLDLEETYKYIQASW